MKRWKVILLVGCLAVVVGPFCGCDKPYLPGDFATELDARIIELRAAETKVDPECAKWLALDREYLESLQKASGSL